MDCPGLAQSRVPHSNASHMRLPRGPSSGSRMRTAGAAYACKRICHGYGTQNCEGAIKSCEQAAWSALRPLVRAVTGGATEWFGTAQAQGVEQMARVQASDRIDEESFLRDVRAWADDGGDAASAVRGVLDWSKRVGLGREFAYKKGGRNAWFNSRSASPCCTSRQTGQERGWACSGCASILRSIGRKSDMNFAAR